MKKSKLKELINDHTKNKSIGDEELILHKYLHNHYSSRLILFLRYYVSLNNMLYVKSNPTEVGLVGDVYFTSILQLALTNSFQGDNNSSSLSLIELEDRCANKKFRYL